MGTKLQESMEEWKITATKLKNENDEYIAKQNELNSMIQKLEEQNKELLSRNEQLEYTIPRITLDNEHLREQIREMVITSAEAMQQHQQIGNKKREKCDVNNMNNAFQEETQNSIDQI